MIIPYQLPARSGLDRLVYATAAIDVHVHLSKLSPGTLVGDGKLHDHPLGSSMPQQDAEAFFPIYLDCGDEQADKSVLAEIDLHIPSPF